MPTRAALLPLLLGLLAGCADQAADRTAAAREMWDARGPAAYGFALSDDGGTEVRVEVREGVVSVETPEGRDAPGTPVQDDGMDGLFALVEREREQGATVNVQFDQELGYPTDLVVQGPGGYRLRVRDFAAQG